MINLSAIKLSIIICTYNRSQSLKKTINSIIESVSENTGCVKIIIVNNNSSDDTCLICDQLKVHCPFEVTCIEETRQGKTYALNAGILQSTGDLIAFLRRLLNIQNVICLVEGFFPYCMKVSLCHFGFDRRNRTTMLRDH